MYGALRSPSTSALGIVVVVLSAGIAQAQAGIQFDLPVQPLAESIRAVGSETNTNVLFDPPLVAGRMARPLKGDLSTDQAFTQLLVGTGIRYEFLNDTTIVLASAARPLPVGRGAIGSETAPTASDSLDSGNSQDDKGGQSKSFWERFRVAQAASGASAGASAVASDAQSTGHSDNKAALEEVIVTAQKREQRAIDVPISMVVMSADELQKREITSIDDLSMAVPGLSIESSGSYVRYIFLRGVSNVFGNSSLIGLYLDEASVSSFPSSFQPDLSTYDLERVEVLRGPQGTLYGDGSAGGTIRFITKNPVLDKFTFDADFTAMFTEDGAPGQRIDEVVNVPLVENEMALRIAGTFDHEGGWINQPAAGVKDFNSQNLVDVRPKLLWQPNSQFTAIAMAEIHRNDAPANKDEDANGNYTQSFNLTTTPGGKDDYDLYNLTLDYDFAAMRVLSTTSYLEQDKEVRHNGTQFEFAPPGTPQSQQYVPLETIALNNFNQELRLMSVGSGPWQWTIGGAYRRAAADLNGHYYYGVPGPPGTPLPPGPYSYQESIVSNSWAVFGDASYKLTDRLTFGTGVRYFRDDQEEEIAPIQTGKFHALSPRFYAQYKLTDQMNTYASAAKGFRSGGFNAVNQPTYGPESVRTYELGAKMSPAGGRLTIDVDVFYTNYAGYQIVGLVGYPPQNIVSNAGDARSKGIEWGLTWRPADQWSLGLNGDYVDSEFTKISATDSSYIVGDPLDYAPKYQYTLSAQRDFKWDGRGGFARLDYNEQGRETYRNRSVGPWYFGESDVIHMLNFHSSLQWNDSLSLGLFAQNLLNDRGYTGPHVADDGVPVRSRPRTVGIEFGVKFD